MRPGQMNRNRNKSERIFQSICHWCEREDSMEIDAGDPAASSYGKREATPGNSLKNALEPKDCMETARNQAEMTQCAASKARAPDRELNQLYLDIRKQYRDDPVFLNALRRAQRAWIRF